MGQGLGPDPGTLRPTLRDRHNPRAAVALQRPRWQPCRANPRPPRRTQRGNPQRARLHRRPNTGTQRQGGANHRGTGMTTRNTFLRLYCPPGPNAVRWTARVGPAEVGRVVPPKSWRVSYAASGLVLESLFS